MLTQELIIWQCSVGYIIYKKKVLLSSFGFVFTTLLLWYKEAYSFYSRLTGKLNFIIIFYKQYIICWKLVGKYDFGNWNVVLFQYSKSFTYYRKCKVMKRKYLTWANFLYQFNTEIESRSMELQIVPEIINLKFLKLFLN